MLVEVGDKPWEDAYVSLLEPRYPPRPMLMEPAISSASPPKMTTFVSPKADRPAVKANGTVSPSERPIVASEINLGSKRQGRSEVRVDVESELLCLCDCISVASFVMTEEVV